MTSTEKLPPLDRYIRVLELLCAYPSGLTLNEISRLLELPKGTTHRILKTMQDMELLTNPPFNALTYILGRRFRRLALSSIQPDWLKAVVGPHLRELTAETKETSFIAKLEGNEVRSVVMEAPESPWLGFVMPGKIMQPHASASAKVLLAFQDKETISRALSAPLEKLTRKTLTNKIEIKKEYQAIKERGFSTCYGELAEGLGAIAVRIPTRPTEILYSLAITGPENRLKKLDLNLIIPTMKRYAQKIAELLTVGIAAEENRG